MREKIVRRVEQDEDVERRIDVLRVQEVRVEDDCQDARKHVSESEDLDVLDPGRRLKQPEAHHVVQDLHHVPVEPRREDAPKEEASVPLTQQQNDPVQSVDCGHEIKRGFQSESSVAPTDRVVADHHHEGGNEEEVGERGVFESQEQS